MLNILWPIFLIVSIFYALFTGNIQNVNNSIFTSTQDAVKLTLNLLGTMCLWCGIMKVAQNTKLINSLKNILKPLINFLFPDLKQNEKIKNEISLNMVANILGLGNAATPMGLKAMESMKEENINKNEITSSMAMLIVINTASIQVIPTTVIAIRLSLNSLNPTKIIIPVWISTVCAAIAGVLAIKFFIKKNNKKYK